MRLKLNQYRPTINQLAGVFFILVAFWPATSFANTASHREIAEKLLLQLKVPTQLKTMADQALNPLRIRLSRVKTTQEKAELVRGYITRLEELIYDAYSWEKNKDSYIKIYTATYTEAELGKLSEFMGSEVGQKFLSPPTEFNRLMASWNKNIAISIKPEMTQIQNELQKDLAGLSASPSDTQ